MLSIYPACFYKESDGGFSVIFPDLNHLATCGDTLQEAMEMAVDCLAGYLFDEKKDGNALPVPSEIENIDINAEYDEYEQAFISLVSVASSVKVCLSSSDILSSCPSLFMSLNRTSISCIACSNVFVAFA